MVEGQGRKHESTRILTNLREFFVNQMDGERSFESEIARLELDHELARAADELLWDYENDKELTAFTVLDAEDFADE